MRATAVLLAGALLLAAPAPASADVIFDPADADELAAVLAEAFTEQGVCYGWAVTVDNVGSRESSVGSNFGAGRAVSPDTCNAYVEFYADITYTSESSESEDSASYGVRSEPATVTRDDLSALDIDFDGLTGEDPDIAVGKAVTALPLLAADKGIAKALSATPDTATSTPADAQLTDDPGSDWWRDRGGMVIWAVVLIAASGLLIWIILRTNRRRRPGRVSPLSAYVPGPEPSTPEEDELPAAPPPKPAIEPEPAPPVAEPVLLEPESAKPAPMVEPTPESESESAIGPEPSVAKPGMPEPEPGKPSSVASASGESEPEILPETSVAESEPGEPAPVDATPGEPEPEGTASGSGDVGSEPEILPEPPVAEPVMPEPEPAKPAPVDATPGESEPEGTASESEGVEFRPAIEPDPAPPAAEPVLLEPESAEPAPMVEPTPETGSEDTKPEPSPSEDHTAGTPAAAEQPGDEPPARKPPAAKGPAGSPPAEDHDKE